MPNRIRMLGTAVIKLIASRNRLDAFTASDVKHFANDSYQSGQFHTLVLCKCMCLPIVHGYTRYDLIYRIVTLSK